MSSQQTSKQQTSPIADSQRKEMQEGAPKPAGFTSYGRPVLFYVKALYDYVAVIEEEMDLNEGDIIAVTSTSEDGWWSGELVDEERRVARKTVFPSNFAQLVSDVDI